MNLLKLIEYHQSPEYKESKHLVSNTSTPTLSTTTTIEQPVGNSSDGIPCIDKSKIELEKNANAIRQHVKDKILALEASMINKKKMSPSEFRQNQQKKREINCLKQQERDAEVKLQNINATCLSFMKCSEAKGLSKETVKEDLVMMFNNDSLTPITHDEYDEKCPECDLQLRQDWNRSIFVCTGCGWGKEYMDSSSTGISTDFTGDTSAKRTIHFLDWLSKLIARPTVDEIDANKLNKIMAYIFSKGVISPNKIRMSVVLDACKFYNFPLSPGEDNAILSKITGRPLPCLTNDDVSSIKRMFIAIQRPFERHSNESRKSFLSYSYVLFKISELLGLKSVLPYFSLLKGQQKLQKQDEIFKLICEELSWDFKPSTRDGSLGDSSDDDAEL